MPNEAQIDDCELLRRYVENGDEAAFAKLVERRIAFVYAVALRRSGGDIHRAQDATQTVFADLARKARVLLKRPTLLGWLHRSAHFAAAALTRTEVRRRNREQEAYAMQSDIADGTLSADWERVRPILDDVLSEVDECDRDAVLLRFFDDRPFAEIGVRLQLSENAARMRVERALDKLHASLTRRGIKSTTAALGVVLAGHAAGTLPSGLASSVTTAALASGALAAPSSLVAFISITKIQAAIVSVLALAGVVAYIGQAETTGRLTKELAELRQLQASKPALLQENRRLVALTSEIEMLKRDHVELAQLEREIREIRRRQAEAAKLTPSRKEVRAVREEIDRLNREGNVLVSEYKVLVRTSKDGSLPSEERLHAATAAEQKLEAIKAKRREIEAFTAAHGATVPKFTVRPANSEPRPNTNEGAR